MIIMIVVVPVGIVPGVVIVRPVMPRRVPGRVIPRGIVGAVPRGVVTETVGETDRKLAVAGLITEIEVIHRPPWIYRNTGITA
jgi:hypothetical protein